MDELSISVGDAPLAAGMARMMGLELEQGLWPESDKPDLLRHQMRTSVLAELRRAGTVDEATLAEAQSLATGQAPSSFGQVLHHPSPPLKLLRAIKDFGKSAAQQPGPVPAEVAYVLYYAAIFAALLRHNQRITSMDDSSIRQGAEWFARQPWIDEQTRELYRQGLAKLG